MDGFSLVGKDTLPSTFLSLTHSQPLPWCLVRPSLIISSPSIYLAFEYSTRSLLISFHLGLLMDACIYIK